jgi:thiol-disulfide isomerase/thioredoxin
MVIQISFRCGHCKKLAPIYDEIAADLHNSGSVGNFDIR